jgi:hypothetical protein
METKNQTIKIPKANVELHAHPGKMLDKHFLDIMSAIEKNKLDIVALSGMNESIYEKVCEQTYKSYVGDSDDGFIPVPLIGHKDEAGIRIDDVNGKSRFLLNAREQDTHEGFHVLTIGYSMDTVSKYISIDTLIDASLKHDALVIISHPFVDTGNSKTAGHIGHDSHRELARISKKYAGQIALEWNGYCLPGVRNIIKFAVNKMNKEDIMQYHDVNKKVEEFSALLWTCHEQVVPVVTGTDLHARNVYSLNAIGTSRIIVDVEGDSASEIVHSMKENIFSNRYENTREYAGLMHWTFAYGLPLLKDISAKKIYSMMPKALKSN